MSYQHPQHPQNSPIPNPSQPAPSIPIQDSEESSAESQHLRALFTEMEGKQLDFLDESGKHIIERVATLLAVLFAVTAFSNNFPPAYLKGNLPAKIWVIVTLILYLAAIGAGMWGIQPRSYKHYTHNIAKLSHELTRITHHKMLWVRLAGILFALGTVTLAILIITIIWSI